MVSSVISVQYDGEKGLLLLNVAFVVEILGIISREHCQIVKILHKMINRGKKKLSPSKFCNRLLLLPRFSVDINHAALHLLVYL